MLLWLSHPMLPSGRVGQHHCSHAPGADSPTATSPEAAPLRCPVKVWRPPSRVLHQLLGLPHGGRVLSSRASLPCSHASASSLPHHQGVGPALPHYSQQEGRVSPPLPGPRAQLFSTCMASHITSWQTNDWQGQSPTLSASGLAHLCPLLQPESAVGSRQSAGFTFPSTAASEGQGQLSPAHDPVGKLSGLPEVARGGGKGAPSPCQQMNGGASSPTLSPQGPAALCCLDEVHGLQVRDGASSPQCHIQ